MTSSGNIFTMAATVVFLSGLSFGFAAPTLAQDLSDDETCLECHDDTDRAAPANPDRPQVHNPDGGFFVEDHEMWSCTDCHSYVVELPHSDEYFEESNEVDCTECHDETPSR